MKRKMVTMLFVGIMTGILFTGCGKSSDNTNSMSDSEVMYLSDMPKAESLPGYLEENGIIVTDAGVEAEDQLREFEFFTYGEMLGQKIQTEYGSAVGISEKTDNGNKVITAKFELEEYIMYTYGFVDRYTGICYIADQGVSANTMIQAEGKEYEVTINFNKEESTITVTCPADYNGAAFLLYGTDEELLEENKENFDKFVSISDIKYVCSECGEFDRGVFAR